MRRVSIVALLAVFSGCTVEAPLDPAGVFGSFFTEVDVGKAIDDALADPANAKPFPVVIGGDSERVFYATNLADIRIRFPGSTNDVVIPSVVGPSNVYQFRDRQRDLRRALLPSAYGLATDGDILAYVSILDRDGLGEARLVVESFGSLFELSAFEGSDTTAFGRNVRVANGRVAFTVLDFDLDIGNELNVMDAFTGEIIFTADSAGFPRFDMRASELVHVEGGVDGERIALTDLDSGETTILVDNLPEFSVGSIHLTNNFVVWSEGLSDGLIRVRRYDLRDGQAELVADAIEGQLHGAADEGFVTQEEYSNGTNKPFRVRIRRHLIDGKTTVIADFREDGRAGQATILGDRIVFVNPDRRVVTVALSGGRSSFAPF